jgi:phospholipase/lecithinase/hemolysin
VYVKHGFAWAFGITLILSRPVLAGPFNQIVVFGDSLSDTGNAQEVLGSLAMDPDDYYMGRFSNGPVWIEYLATQLQLPSPVANLISSSGRNYAFGGARTDGSGLVSFFINDIDEQVPDYLNNDGGPSGDELIVLWGGANDFLDGETNASVPVNNLVNDITDLYAAGGRNFMVVNLPLLGQTPRYVGSSNEPVFDALSTLFNSQLDLSLDSLETTLTDVEFFRVDAGALIGDAVTNPAAYGFTNVTNQALGLSGIDPEEYLFWDDVHPTTAGHNLLAQNAAEVLFDALGVLAGDLNFDGFVGIDDLNVVLGNWNATVTPGNPLFGDASGDGFVGIDDLNTVLGNWNAGTPPGDGSTQIPEPAVVWLIGPGLLGLLCRRRGGNTLS